MPTRVELHPTAKIAARAVVVALLGVTAILGLKKLRHPGDAPPAQSTGASASESSPASDHKLPLSIDARVVGVHDGDSVTVLTAENTQVKIRLEGIDAPELKQAFGSKAKQELSTLIFGKQVTIKNHGLDRYKRTIGRIFYGRLDVNLEMVRRGFAWRYDKYSKEAALADAQSKAKTEKAGLWADVDPVPPWEWRASKRK